jgi:glycine/D-amino acid oxidase-like deaminating enzyme
MAVLYENSEVIRIKDGNPAQVKTKQGKITAKHVIVATNVPTMPLVARGTYCMSEYPKESYIIACLLPKKYQGMYISPDKDNYSILPIVASDGFRLLVGGEGHISGLRGNVQARYQRLADFAEKQFGVTEITHRWSDRDYLAYDNVPLIGKLYPWSKNLYVATAMMKWGLSNGTVAAMILNDLITKQENAWSKVFDSCRTKPIKSIPRVAGKYLIGKG